MITKWSGITYRYKDLYGHLHCFKDKQKAKESYRKFLHENELYNGCWLGDNHYIVICMGPKHLV